MCLLWLWIHLWTRGDASIANACIKTIEDTNEANPPEIALRNTRVVTPIRIKNISNFEGANDVGALYVSNMNLLPPKKLLT